MLGALSAVLSAGSEALERLAFLLAALFLAVEFVPAAFKSLVHRGKPLPRVHKETPRGRTVKDVPGPWPSLPVLGTSWITTKFGPYSMSQLHTAYRDMFERYGDIVREEAVWNHPVVSLKSRADIEKVLRAQSRAPLRPPTEIVSAYRRSRPDRYASVGIVNEQGEKWQHLRRVLTPGITSGRVISRFLPELDVVTDEFVALLRARRGPDGTVAAFDELAMRMGLESACTLVLGKRMGFLEATVDGVAKQLADAVNGHFRASRDTFFGLPFWKILPTQAYSLFVECEEHYYDVISGLVEAALREEEGTCEVEPVRSVFMSILHAPDLDLRDKKAAVIDFIAAGITTLGSSLTFLLYNLAKNPSVQQRLHEEISSLVPQGAPVTSENLRSAKYLRAVISESFRVLPAAICLARILESELELSGYSLPAGCVVLCHTWLASLEEKNFTKAKEFHPERWIPEEREKLCFTNHSPELLIPFGSGTRICPGKRFTEMVLEVFLAKVARDFHLTFKGEMNLKFEFLLNPSGPIDFVFQERQ